ncbi:MAG: DUF2304 domain-containing protein [Solirubrobacterales bacterium]
MSTKLQVVAIMVSSGVLLIVLELVRQRRLGERYALLWLVTGSVLLLLSAWSDLLDKVSDLLGVSNPTNALFGIAFGFVLLLLLHFSMTVSRLAEENKMLAQEAARLDQELRSRLGSPEERGSGSAEGGDSAAGETPREPTPSSASTSDQ